MNTQNYLKTGLIRLALYAGLGLISVNSLAMAQTADYVSPANTASQSIKTTVEAPTHSLSKTLKLYNGDYMKTTYRDLNVKLLGPFNVTIEDEHLLEHFTNLNTLQNQTTQNPYETNGYIASNYYQSTIAKTGFKIKF